ALPARGGGAPHAAVLAVHQFPTGGIPEFGSETMPHTRLFALAALILPLAATGASAQGSKPGVPVPDGVTFRAADILSEGTRMSAEVFAPAGTEARKLPTVIMSHGWGGLAEHLRPTAIAFAKAGYLVIAFDYRGWGKSDSRLVLAGTTSRDKDGK